jgi:hypothetical protein
MKTAPMPSRWNQYRTVRGTPAGPILRLWEIAMQAWSIAITVTGQILGLVCAILNVSACVVDRQRRQRPEAPAAAQPDLSTMHKNVSPLTGD